MSAFVVSNETMNRVVNCPLIEGCDSSAAKDQLGNELYKMNAQAVQQRYKDREQEQPKFRYSPKNYSNIEILKAMHCLRYQCSEGNVPEQSLYAALTSWIQTLEHEIVCRHPAYEAADWDA